MTRIPRAFGVAIAVILGGGLVFAAAIYTESRAWNWVLHTREVLERLEATRYAMAVKDPAGFDSHLRALRALTADNPSQQRNVSRLAGSGSAELDAVLADMRAEEERLLAQRTEEAARARNATIAASVAFVALAIALLFFVRSVAARDARRIAELAGDRKLALDAARMGWFQFDPRTGLVRHDGRVAELHGVQGDANTVQALMASMHEGDRARVWQSVQRALDPSLRMVYEEEYRILPPGGGERWIRTHGIGVFDATGAATRLVGTASDITQRKEAEAALAELNRTLEARVAQRTRALQDANEAMEAFTYSVSHDLRAPLRGIHGYAEAVQEDFGASLPQAGRDYLQRIAASAARMEDLISDLLAYSRLSRDELELGAVPLDSAVGAAMQALKAEIAATGATIDVAPRLGSVRAARPILVQAIQNLLSNAMKFVPPGTAPCVRVESKHLDGHVRLIVADNGIGIAEKHQERVFRVFERLHGVDVYPGTGIGLAIVRKGVERMGGHVGVESETGRGSRFWIDLPQEG